MGNADTIQSNYLNTNFVSILTNESMSKLLSNLSGVAVLGIIAKVFAFIREAIILAKIGVCDELDTFIFAQNIHNTCINIFFIAISTYLIPLIFKRMNTEKNDLKSENINSNEVQMLFSFGLLISVVIILVLLIIALVYYLYSPLAYFSLDNRYLILLLLCPYLFFSFIISFQTTVLNANSEYFASIIIIIFSHLFTVLMLFWVDFVSPIIVVLVCMNFTSFVQVALMNTWIKRRYTSLMMLCELKLPDRDVLLELLKLGSSNTLTSINLIVDQTMAMKFKSNGISYLEYGNKINSFFSAIVSSALNAVVTPFFGGIIAKNRVTELKRYYYAISLLVFSCATFISLIVSYYSRDIVTLLLMRGHLNLGMVNEIADVLYFFNLGFPFYITGIVGVRLLIALNKNNILLMTSIMNVILNVLLNLFFINIFGFRGIALATSTVYLIISIVIFVKVRNLLRNM